MNVYEVVESTENPLIPKNVNDDYEVAKFKFAAGNKFLLFKVF